MLPSTRWPLNQCHLVCQGLGSKHVGVFLCRSISTLKLRTCWTASSCEGSKSKALSAICAIGVHYIDKLCQGHRIYQHLESLACRFIHVCRTSIHHPSWNHHWKHLVCQSTPLSQSLGPLSQNPERFGSCYFCVCLALIACSLLIIFPLCICSCAFSQLVKTLWKWNMSVSSCRILLSKQNLCWIWHIGFVLQVCGRQRIWLRSKQRVLERNLSS